MFNEMTKNKFLECMMKFSSETYINKDTGECYFNTDEFKELIEIANSFSAEINYDELYERTLTTLQNLNMLIEQVRCY